ncbi:hypothetical protein AN215_13370 [Streptomyces abyssalis]|uniref:Uncharacterized protein n=1 Tax=Streptomyces abyssalis TaxID=933944 RepID=A0A1E7JQ69_9ACTN|nr:hypothetical protein AN215_13370 [Streptomyces abyssalis]
MATMVGGVSMLGAGVASAGGAEEQPPRSVTINCDQSNGDTSSTSLGGLVTVTGPLISIADSRAQQNICGIDNDGNVNTAGDATGGEASDGGVIPGL